MSFILPHAQGLLTFILGTILTSVLIFFKPMGGDKELIKMLISKRKVEKGGRAKMKMQKK